MGPGRRVTLPPTRPGLPRWPECSRAGTVDLSFLGLPVITAWFSLIKNLLRLVHTRVGKHPDMAGTACVVLGAGPVCLMPGLSSKPQDPGWGSPPSVFSELSMQLMELPRKIKFISRPCVSASALGVGLAPSHLLPPCSGQTPLSRKEAASLAGCYVISLLQRKEDFLQPIFSKGLGTMKFCHGSVIWISV